MTEQQQPNPDLVNDLFWGIFKPQLIRMALQIDVFSPLAKSPANAEYVAQICQCSIRGIKVLLDYLCSLHIVERNGDKYSLTLTAETFLVRGNKAYAGDMILHYTDKTLFDNIYQSIQSGKPSWLGENFVQDAWLESYSAWRIPKSLEMWQASGIKHEQYNEFRILDIACGCAIKSFSLAQTLPSIQVTCLDMPEVLNVARDLAERMKVNSQVVYKPENLLSAELGKSEYNAVLLGQITDYLTAEQNQNLFSRIYTALSENGVLIIDCPMQKDEPAEFPSFATLFLWANSGGTAYPFETYHEWLTQIGFQNVEQIGERWSLAKK